MVRGTVRLRFMNSKGVPGQTEVNPDVHFVLGDKGYVCQQPNGETWPCCKGWRSSKNSLLPSAEGVCVCACVQATGR